MAHLLPPAGVQEPKGDQFRFHSVVENTACDRRYDDIPVNIHDYRWTDYAEEDRKCRAQNQQYARQQQQSDIHRAKTEWAAQRAGRTSSGQGYTVPGQSSSGHCGGSHGPGVAAQWGFCPPIGVDPRSLIRPLSQSVDSSTRPTGDPYFAQDSQPSCPPHRAPLARKGGFNFQNWLDSYNKRLPPAHLKETCVPSLCTWCRPIYVDCCPDYLNPWAYSIAHVGPFYS
ncbi:unnamed protein product [Candidula unifasciata]|uniref:Uncharacterized protein n=1 Tax=Candidula unifasciata TaxID=100452 RepID=A0A8S3YZX6_9EUPU|nr:unnamed protein product [Candidula unifasciata]